MVLSSRVGLTVGVDSLDAVLLQGGRALARLRRDRVHGRQLELEISELLRDLPRTRMRRRREVVVALGPADARVKSVLGVPRLKNRRAYDSVLRENITRFFVGSRSMRLGGFQVQETGAVRAWTLDEQLVTALREGCELAHARLVGVLPATEVHLDATARATCQSDVGEEGLQRAVLAARAGHKNPIALRPARAASHEASRAQRFVAFTLAVSGALALFTLPIAAAEWRMAEAKRYLESVSGRLAQERARYADMARLARPLSSTSAFAEGAQGITPLLGALTMRIPPTAAVQSLELDSLYLTVTLVGRDLLTIPGRLADWSGVSSPEVVGPITHDAAGQELQRMTLRMRRARAGAEMWPAPIAATPAMNQGRPRS